MTHQNLHIKNAKTDCIFCKVIAGDVPSYTIYEDDNFMAFLDVFPRVKGHVLVVPKKHIHWVDEVEAFGDYFEVAKKIGVAAKGALGAEWNSYVTVGTDVPHAHIHVLPRKTDDGQTDVVDFGKILELSDNEQQEIALKYRNKLGGV